MQNLHIYICYVSLPFGGPGAQTRFSLQTLFSIYFVVYCFISCFIAVFLQCFDKFSFASIFSLLSFMFFYSMFQLLEASAIIKVLPCNMLLNSIYK